MFVKKAILWFLSIKDDILNFVTLKIKQVEYKNIAINGKLVICGNGKIILGNGVTINSSLRSNPIGGQERSLFVVSKGAKLEIGNNSGISNTAIVCKQHIRVGRNVMIGGNTKIYDTDFHSLDYKKRLSPKTDIAVNRPISIEDGAFVGAHVIILKGVIIGEKSIIAAGSIVTKSVPAGELWGGVPAEFIRKLEE